MVIIVIDMGLWVSPIATDGSDCIQRVTWNRGKPTTTWGPTKFSLDTPMLASLYQDQNMACSSWPSLELHHPKQPSDSLKHWNISAAVVIFKHFSWHLITGINDMLAPPMTPLVNTWRHNQGGHQVLDALSTGTSLAAWTVQRSNCYCCCLN